MNIYILLVGLLISCSAQKELKTDPLPSFNEGTAKENIINFVEAVSDVNSKKYVAPENRIVCFDNDGTLWVEQPLPSQLYFAVDEIKSYAAKYKPDWAKQQPFKAVLENDEESIKKFGQAEIITLAGKAEQIASEKNYDKTAYEWVMTSKQPVMHKTYAHLIYQPMIELLNYLRKKQFTIYIVSGGGQDFMRAWAPELYSVQKPYIIGTTFKKEVITKGTSKYLKVQDELDFYDDKDGKILNIDKHLGKKPIMIVGNSDGDLPMMEYATTNNTLPTFMLYLKHTDGVREFDYSKGVLTGALKEGEKVAQEKGWTIIDMKKDWNTVFVK